MENEFGNIQKRSYKLNLQTLADNNLMSDLNRIKILLITERAEKLRRDMSVEVIDWKSEAVKKVIREKEKAVSDGQTTK